MMNKQLWLGSSVTLGLMLLASVPAFAVQPEVKTSNLKSEGTLVAQLVGPINSVSELRDVSPRDWAYEALRNLSERYGCVRSYGDGSYRGNQPITRYEFAVGLNDCLQKIEALIQANGTRGGDSVNTEDLEMAKRLADDFKAELATIGARVDTLEAKVKNLEDNQFSTTTKLQGEVVMALSGAFGGENVGVKDNNEIVFQNRARLNFVTSFTGKDALHTRLDAGNTQAFNNIEQGGFTFSGYNGNDVGIGWLAYYFPIGEKGEVYLPAAYPLWQDFVPTVSPYLEGYTGGSNALTSFAESSPIYKIGLAGGGGVGVNYDIIDSLKVSAGYFSGYGSDSSSGNGLFDGEFAALGQLTWTPNDKIQVAATYVNSYQNDGQIFDLGVGTTGAKAPFGGNAATTNSVGLAASYKVSPKFAVNAFGGYTNAQEVNSNNEAEIWYYGLGAAVPDLGKEGNLLGLMVGAEPYVGETDDVALHVETFYRYQLTDNISITPGLVWLGAPGGSKDNDDVFLGTLRTTFTF